MEKLYYSIGEVAGLLDENVSAIRFWSNTFTQFIKPARTAKGNRQFTAADLEVFKKIKHLLKVTYFYKSDFKRKLWSDHSK